MPQPLDHWTLEMVHALPDDGNRYELVDGDLLVSPAPTLFHQRVLSRLYDVLRPYVERIGGHETLFAPAAVTFSSVRELQPDLLVLPLRPDGGAAESFAEVGRLLLAVEVLSPSTVRNDRYTKRRVYQEQGVPETWIVDSDARLVERWRPGDAEPEVCIGTLEWCPDAAQPPMVVDLERLFSRS